MEDLKFTIARNISQLRKINSITQAELAEKLNYSDKAISKWERGESVPDVAVLKQIADMFDVTVDYLLTKDHTEYNKQHRNISKRRYKNRVAVTLMSIVLALGVALTTFVLITMVTGQVRLTWTAFIVAIPVMCIVWLVFNTLWFNRRLNYLIITIIMWSLLTIIYIFTFKAAHLSWLIFLLGIPGQIIIILWSRIKPEKRKYFKK
ncbi:MAG: helix-turn-helix transcriptional regulator [Acutalibacteraceae bacterium]|nr:helix-turn-helix transcriptional regulator [Acutalibacteraceae bacterium]